LGKSLRSTKRRVESGDAGVTVGPQYFKYLIPKDSFWTKRIMLLFAFVIFDYLATVAFCKNAVDEGNFLARMFMTNYGIALGLAVFDVLINVPVYVILCLDSHLIKLPKPWAKTTEVFIDFALAWFVAGPHFYGALSWMSAVPELLATFLGAVTYLMLVFPLIYYEALKKRFSA